MTYYGTYASSDEHTDKSMRSFKTHHQLDKHSAESASKQIVCFVAGQFSISADGRPQPLNPDVFYPFARPPGRAPAHLSTHPSARPPACSSVHPSCRRTLVRSLSRLPILAHGSNSFPIPPVRPPVAPVKTYVTSDAAVLFVFL